MGMSSGSSLKRVVQRISPSAPFSLLVGVEGGLTIIPFEHGVQEENGIVGEGIEVS